jgi:hypothetical protein
MLSIMKWVDVNDIDVYEKENKVTFLLMMNLNNFEILKVKFEEI